MRNMRIDEGGLGRPGVFIALATTLHVAMLASLRPSSRPQVSEEAIETELVVERAQGDSRASTEAVESRLDAVNDRPTRRSYLGRGPAGGRPAEVAGSAPEKPLGSEGRAPWTFSPLEPRMANLASAGVVGRAVSSIVEQARLPGSGSDTGGVAEALDAHDATVGLGRGGPMLTAVENAAEGSDAPFEGTALFDVGVDVGGNVSVALLDASSERPGWESVGSAAKRAIDPKRVRLPPGASGWHAIVRVEAKPRFPDGVEPRHLGTKVTATPMGVNLTSKGKVCQVSIAIGVVMGISGGCDVSNLGTQPTRIVRGHVVSEGRL